MIINIPKIQLGGGLPPYVSYTPVTVNNAAADYSPSALETSTKSSSSDDTKGEITNKDLLTMLKDIDGLPSDMLNLYRTLNMFYQMEDAGVPNTTSLSRQYLQAIQLIKTAKYNKEVFDTAYKNLEKNGGLNEVAISATGKLIGMNSKGELKLLSIDEALNTKDYQIMTNAELLLYRAELPTFAGDNDMIKFAGNGIGMEQVTDIITKIIGKLGTSETSYKGDLSKEGQTIKGLLVLLQAYAKEDALGVSLDGLYKAGIVSQSLLTQAQAALLNVLTLLPQNAKTLLLVKAGSENGAIDLINSIINSQASSKYEFSMQQYTDAEGNKIGSKGKTTKTDEEKINSNVALLFIQGFGEKESFPITGGTNDGLLVLVNTLPLVTKEGKPLGVGSTLLLVSESQYGGIFDMQNATMGGLEITDAGVMRVITDGQAHSIDMPIDAEAAAKGIIKPDLNLFKKKEKADEYIRERNITNYDAINKVYLDNGISAKYDSNGNLRSEQWRRFAVFNATALNSAFKQDATFSGLEEEDDENLTLGYLELLRKANNWNEKEFKFDAKSWTDKYLWDNGHDAFYKGTVFIPIKTNAFNALAGSGTTLNSGQSQYIEALELQKDRLLGYVNSGSFTDD